MLKFHKLSVNIRKIYRRQLRFIDHYSHKAFWPWRASDTEVDSGESPGSWRGDTRPIVHHNWNSWTPDSVPKPWQSTFQLRQLKSVKLGQK